MYKRYWNILKFRDYNRYMDQMNEENRNGIALFLGITMMVTLINIIIHIFSYGFASFSWPMAVTSFYVIVITGLYFFYYKRHLVHFTRWIFIFECPIYLYAITMGTIADPTHAAYSFPLLLVVLPLFIMARPCLVMAYILFYSVLFMIADFAIKPLSLVHLDLLHIANATLMAMGAAAFLLVIRIRNMKYAQSLKQKSFTDALTGAYNRAGFKSKVNMKKPGIFVFMDVDDFKNINDTYGHAKGDEVLISLVRVLNRNFRDDDVIARFGGDEFGVYCPGRFNQETIDKKFTELMEDIKQITLPSASLKVTVSIGIVQSNGQYKHFDDILRQADKQMYYVKTHGKNNYQS